MKISFPQKSLPDMSPKTPTTLCTAHQTQDGIFPLSQNITYGCKHTLSHTHMPTHTHIQSFSLSHIHYHYVTTQEQYHMHTACIHTHTHTYLNIYTLTVSISQTHAVTHALYSHIIIASKKNSDFQKSHSNTLC